MARPPIQLKTSRLITTAISTVVWWVIAYGTGVFVSGGSKVMHVPPITMAVATSLIYLCIPYFATHRVLMGGLRGVLNGRIILPDAGVDAGANASNAWRASAINALIFGAVPALAGFLLASGSTTEFSARQFAVRMATAAALLAGTVVFVVAGRPLLQATRVPRGRPRFNGDPKPYLSGHFMIPHAVANCVINAALAFSLSPVPFAGGTGRVPTTNVVIDSAITFAILTWIIARGARSQALTEAEWGIAPPAAGTPQSVIKGALVPLAAALAFSIVLGVAFTVTHTAAIGIYSWAVFRGVVYGGYSAWLAKSVAQAAIHGVFTRAPASAPAVAPAQGSAA